MVSVAQENEIREEIDEINYKIDLLFFKPNYKDYIEQIKELEERKVKLLCQWKSLNTTETNTN